MSVPSQKARKWKMIPIACLLALGCMVAAFGRIAVALHDSDHNRFFLPVLKTAGLPHMRMHDLRHSAATFLLERGVHAKVVSEMLGHKSVATTLDVYSHVTPTMQFEAAAQMQSVFEPEPKQKAARRIRIRAVTSAPLAHVGARTDFALQIEKTPIALTTGI